MKKLIALFLVATLLSCSSEDQTIQSSDVSALTPLSVLDGKLLSFKNDESFIEEYNGLVELKTGKELQDWISKKGHSSFLNVKKSDKELEGESDVVDANYSDALKAILNSESKVKIAGKVIWLNDFKFYKLLAKNENKKLDELISLTGDLEVYGSILGLNSDNNATGKAVPNANRSKDWGYGYNNGTRDKSISLSLFNETIYLNNVVQSTKMFIRVLSQGKYCSVWKCRWNSEDGGKVTLSFSCNVNYPWIGGGGTIQLSDANNTAYAAVGSDGVPNLIISGIATVTWVDNGYTKTWSQPLSWY
jgi:hypothetical protein